MLKSPEQSHPSKQESAEFQKPTQEQLQTLLEKLHRLPDISDRVSFVKQHIERIQHESATGDDAPRLYGLLESELKQLNEELAELPDSIEL